MRRAPPLEARLRSRLKELGSVVVALSGGVDSSLLAAIAKEELGERMLAVTGVSASLSGEELSEIRSFCAERSIPHETVETNELSLPAYVENQPDRCYHCKHELFEKLDAFRRARGFAFVVEGTHADDLGSHRPSREAAAERGVISPLVDVGATKEEIRALAKALGLENADRPAQPCLSSRIAYGVSVTPERLDRIARAERLLKDLGFAEVRVRLHDAIARIEVPRRDLARALEHAPHITRELKALGFVYVTLDLEGLRSGSLLEVIGARA